MAILTKIERMEAGVTDPRSLEIQFKFGSPTAQPASQIPQQTEDSLSSFLSDIDNK